MPQSWPMCCFERKRRGKISGIYAYCVVTNAIAKAITSECSLHLTRCTVCFGFPGRLYHPCVLSV